MGLGISFFIFGYVGNLLSPIQGSVGLLWPPTGLALGVLLLFSSNLWPGILLGGFFVNLLIWGRPPLVSLAVVTGATVGVLCGYVLLRRVGFRIQLDRMRDLIALVALGAVAGMTITSTVRVGTLTLAGLVPADRFWTAWWLDELSSIMGVIIVTPVVLLASRIRRLRPPRPRRVVEAAAVLGAAFVVMSIATHARSELLFLIFPVLIWAALRFQVKLAAPCVLLVSLLTVYGAAVGSGPFEGQGLSSKVDTVLAFELATALTSLVLAVTTVERIRAHGEVERTADELASVVAQLSRSLGRRLVPPVIEEATDRISGERRVVRERIRTPRDSRVDPDTSDLAHPLHGDTPVTPEDD
ncbi:MASE1 domain-containing protein [Actinopolymorpha rutila]|uniref:Integral membrane sensor domain MASE1 n=1 Tax=Actinopolymorpha rutila TaxID=446787 RepID=A0A852ZP24_9ACTN|nr:integral membrane sensor domain MASE1 [Actinopolymorpha rutila]